MGLFKAIKKKWNNWYYHDLDDDELDEWDDDKVYDAAYFEDKDQRAVYVLEELGKMAEAADKMDEYQAEYEAVTSLLVDMEEIEALPKPVRLDIMDIAKRIEGLEKQRRTIFAKTGRMSEADVTLMQRHEDDIPDAIGKIKEAEEYRRLIKHDLKRLDNERSSVRYRKSQLKSIVANSRGVAIICAVAMIICMLGLVALQFAYEMNVSIGYFIIGGSGAIAITYIYVRYVTANAELTKISKVINKLITLHNTVKIRYINNTNLLQYLYMKYDVEAAEELEDKWNIYIEEESARHLDEQIKADLEYQYNKLTMVLKKNSIKDPDIWTHQAKALYDNREMVEVRHALVGRRQKLREQMEYNEKIAKESRDNIKDLGTKYPKYSTEIANMVSNFEGL